MRDSIVVVLLLFLLVLVLLASPLGLADFPTLALVTAQLNVAAEAIDGIAELGRFLREDLDRIGQIIAISSTPEEFDRVVTRLRTVLNPTKSFDALLLAIKAGGGPRAEIGDRVNGDFFLRERSRKPPRPPPTATLLPLSLSYFPLLSEKD